MTAPTYENGAEPVWKATIVVTVLAQSPDGEDLRNMHRDMGLAEIAEAIDTGDMIGSVSMPMFRALPEERVVPELLEMGNDGEFFNMDEDGHFEEPAWTDEPDAQILRLQIERSWDALSLQLMQKKFIEKMGLTQDFAYFLVDEAEQERSYAKKNT